MHLFSALIHVGFGLNEYLHGCGSARHTSDGDKGLALARHNVQHTSCSYDSRYSTKYWCGQMCVVLFFICNRHLMFRVQVSFVTQ